MAANTKPAAINAINATSCGTAVLPVSRRQSLFPLFKATSIAFTGPSTRDVQQQENIALPLQGPIPDLSQGDAETGAY